VLVLVAVFTNTPPVSTNNVTITIKALIQFHFLFMLIADLPLLFICFCMPFGCFWLFLFDSECGFQRFCCLYLDDVCSCLGPARQELARCLPACLFFLIL